MLMDAGTWETSLQGKKLLRQGTTNHYLHLNHQVEQGGAHPACPVVVKLLVGPAGRLSISFPKAYPSWLSTAEFFLHVLSYFACCAAKEQKQVSPRDQAIYRMEMAKQGQNFIYLLQSYLLYLRGNTGVYERISQNIMVIMQCVIQPCDWSGQLANWMGSCYSCRMIGVEYFSYASH